MVESLNGKTIGFWVNKGEVYVELLGYEPVHFKPETIREITKSLETLADEAERTQPRELKIDFDEIYAYLEQPKAHEPTTKPKGEPLTFAQTQEEPFRSFANEQGKKFNGVGVKLGIKGAKLFGPNVHKTDEELFKQIYGNCYWEE